VKDWKTLAAASDTGIPESEIDAVAAPLEALEKVFRPLVKDLTPDQEPDVAFNAAEEEA
jgi:hypothetical protein